jgi:FkbM family methyltransferase
VLLEFIFDEQLRLRIYRNDLVHVSEGDTVLDVGSHLGTFTASALNDGAGRVVAIEPEPFNIACFKRTFDAEIQEGRVILVEAAASDRPGTLSFSPMSDGLSAWSKVAEDGELVVEAVTIDEVVDRLGLDRVDFVKMDIEGSERQALAGAREVLARFAPRMALAAYHDPGDPEALAQIALSAHSAYKSVIRGGFAYFGRELLPSSTAR